MDIRNFSDLPPISSEELAITSPPQKAALERESARLEGAFRGLRSALHAKRTEQAQVRRTMRIARVFAEYEYRVQEARTEKRDTDFSLNR